MKRDPIKFCRVKDCVGQQGYVLGNTVGEEMVSIKRLWAVHFFSEAVVTIEH